jgi:hypothetical protein
MSYGSLQVAYTPLFLIGSAAAPRTTAITGTPVLLNTNNPDKTIACYGTFGTATVTIQCSLVQAFSAGNIWTPTDPAGNPLVFDASTWTSQGLTINLPDYVWIRGVLATPDGTTSLRCFVG